jgi:hypothetical protein
MISRPLQARGARGKGVDLVTCLATTEAGLRTLGGASDEGKARRMCGEGVIEGQGEVRQKPARAVAPETRLARLMERELHLAIDPQRLSPLHHRPSEQNLGSGSSNPR